MILSNEAVALPCDIEGNPLDYSPATGTAYVYKGASDVSASATWTVSWSGMTGTWTASSDVQGNGDDSGCRETDDQSCIFRDYTDESFTVTKALKNIKVNKLSAISGVLGEVTTGKITNTSGGKKALVINDNAVEFTTTTTNGEFCGRIRGSKFQNDGVHK